MKKVFSRNFLFINKIVTSDWVLDLFYLFCSVIEFNYLTK